MSIVARALAGGLAGVGRGITSEHERREEAKGVAKRQAWETEQNRLREAGADRRSQVQADATLAAADTRAETIQRGQDVSATSAQYGQDQATVRTQIQVDQREAEGRRKEDLSVIEMLSTRVETDEDGNPLGEPTIDGNMYFALREGLDKFGDVPAPEEAMAYLASSQTPNQRVWPRETSYTWDDIAGLVGEGRSFAGPAEVRAAMSQARDQLAAIGAQVPDGSPPQEGRMSQTPAGPGEADGGAYAATPPIEGAPEHIQGVEPPPAEGGDTSTKENISHIRRRIQNRLQRRGGG